MKANERDELLIRLDEQTRNIYHLVERQEVHLSEINGSIKNHAVGIASTRKSVSLAWRVILFAVFPLIVGGITLAVVLT